ncbi:MAG: hypothetical protein HY901_36725 [Deltaproteobacteria bacterium]|nr:hypothetical protein [Deltaproteobacteria bacterium]
MSASATLSAARPAPLATTGIGSLPHTQLEVGMQLALSVDVPYLPELPRREAAECFTAQALEALPGLHSEPSCRLTLDLEAWQRGSFELDARLDEADERGSVESFLPSASCEAWSPFLWEVASRRLTFAKVQCAGPATVLAAVSAGSRTSLPAPLEQQVVRLVLDRALAMARAVRAAGAVPIVFLDEPMIGAVRRASPAAQARELDLLRHAVLGLRNEGAITGLHCCGEADWAPLLRLGLDLLSFDATVSLQRLLVERPDVERFLESGGWLGLGLVPTDAKSEAERTQRLSATLAALEALPKALRTQILTQSLLTPACGLGTRSIEETERVFESLVASQARLRALL